MLDVDRIVGEALGERAVVLLGEDRGGREHQHLLALTGRLEGGAQGHLGLAIADVAADQPVHRSRRFHVGLDQFDRLQLVGCLGEGEALLEFPLPVGVGLERMAAATPTLGVQAQQLSRQLLRGAAGARLHRLPARASELGQRRVLTARPDIARDLRELLGGDEHAVVALIFEVEVVARDVRDRARLKAGEPRDAVILMHDDVARAQLGERAQRAAAYASRGAPSGLTGRRARALGAAAAQQTMLGEDRELQLRGDEALAQRRGDEAQRGLEYLARNVDVLAQPRGLHAAEVVGRPLALAATRERHDRAVAGAHELLELGLGLGQRARGGIGGLRPQLQWLLAGDRRQPDPRPPGECGFDVLGTHIQVVGVRVGERGADVGPVV